MSIRYALTLSAFVISFAAFFPSAQAVTPIKTLYSTGVNGANAPIGLKKTDTHWQVRMNNGKWFAAKYDKTNYCTSCGRKWMDHPIGNNAKSRPLAHPKYMRKRMPRKLFSWRTSFVLPRNADLRTVTISYRVGYDDVSKDPSNRRTFRGCVHTIWVNGKPYVMKAKGNPIRTQCAATLPRNAVYRYGKNSLEFRIQNLATYYGFRFEKIRAHFQVKRPKVANLRLFSTGVDNANRPIGLKKTDTHWQVRMNNGKWFAAKYDKTNYCTSCGRKWVDHPIGNNAKSRPLAHPKYMRKRMPRKLFSWRTFFTIPRGANLRTVVVSYKAGYDDVSKDPSNRRTFRGCVHTIWVNGKPYVMKAKGNPIRTQCAATIPMNAAYKHGKNSIEFRIQNLATYYGFRFEKVRATVQFGAASGSLGKVYRRRRRRMQRRGRRRRRGIRR